MRVHEADPPERARPVHAVTAPPFPVKLIVPNGTPDPTVSVTVAVNVTALPAPTVGAGEGLSARLVLPSVTVTVSPPVLLDEATALVAVTTYVNDVRPSGTVPLMSPV